tara:strand:- start:2566 stop:2997 length:432 start_codon:yes stop_codon:yes gene_type:complete
MIDKILNQLFEFSNHFIVVKNDINLPMPGFSMIEEDIHYRLVPTTIINTRLIPQDDSVMAHILAHEWGHHVLEHIEHYPPSSENMPDNTTRQLKENEADAYAAEFIKKYNYDKDSIIQFFREHPHDLENRISILNSAFTVADN